MKKSPCWLALVAVFTIATGARAQNESRPDSSLTTNDTVAVAPHALTHSVIDESKAAVQRAAVSPSALPRAMAQSNAGLGQSKALMIVGGAALITGAIVGGKPGTIIMVGGAVVGLYGLYQYLQ